MTLLATNNQSLTLPTDVSGSASTPAFQWLLDGETLENANHAQLVMEEIDQEAAGLYELVINNDVWAVTSQVARVYVAPSTKPFDRKTNTLGAVSEIFLTGTPRESFFLQSSLNGVRWETIEWVEVDSSLFAASGEGFAGSSGVDWSWPVGSEYLEHEFRAMIPYLLSITHDHSTILLETLATRPFAVDVSDELEDWEPWCLYDSLTEPVVRKQLFDPMQTNRAGRFYRMRPLRSW